MQGLAATAIANRDPPIITDAILQRAALVNPLVYASEGLRGTMVPQFPHLSLLAVVVALVFFNALLPATGLHKFYGKAVS